MKKPIPIEQLVRWAYRDELPKAQPLGGTFLRPDTWSQPWGAITKTGLLGGTVQEPDVRNRYGLAPDRTAQTMPHPDAIAVYWAVQDLDQLHLDLPEDWSPLSDLGDLGADGLSATARALDALSVRDKHGVRHLREDLSFTIRRGAILSPPDWKFPAVERKIVSHWNGKPKWFMRQQVQSETGSFEVEVDGFDNSKRRPRAGAYQKTYLDPDPVDAAISRGQYEIWHAALAFLAAEIGDRLDDHLPLPSVLPARPWEGPNVSSQRILIDRTPRTPIMRDQRPTAGPPPFRGLAANDPSGEIRKRSGRRLTATGA